MADETLVSAKNLYRYYGQHCAVADLSLQLRKGEVLGLLGPNGAGKSTTMQMLSGNLAPSQGEIKINNIDLLDNPQQAQHYIGYLPERPPVYRDMTVDEYLEYCSKLHRIDKTKRRNAINLAKHRCGLMDVGKRLIGNISKGYQQRVGIAQAILHNPVVVILDEPTVGLDPIQIREIRNLIRELGNDHSVILSTHILPEVQAVCDRVQIIHHGKVAFDDTLEGLEKRHAEPVLTVSFRKAADLSALRSIVGVEAVEPFSHHRYRIIYQNDARPTESLCKLALENDWELEELTPQHATLEQIFMSLVHQEKDDTALETSESKQEEKAA